MKTFMLIFLILLVISFSINSYELVVRELPAAKEKNPDIRAGNLFMRLFIVCLIGSFIIAIAV
ncbi:MAG: hypothetical protein HZA07_05390, partial [Nitrospirae bacterium]|nr:hypothetical protein [Nitrospirota bacterium]